MHELSIATELLEQLEQMACAHRVEHIESVKLTVGVMRQVVPEALHMAWKAVSADTLAEGSNLIITEEPIQARCNLCHQVYEACIDDYQCPQCQLADVSIIQGKDITIRTISGLQQSGVSDE